MLQQAPLPHQPTLPAFTSGSPEGGRPLPGFGVFYTGRFFLDASLGGGAVPTKSFEKDEKPAREKFGVSSTNLFFCCACFAAGKTYTTGICYWHFDEFYPDPY